MVVLLVTNGADPSLTDAEGMSLLDMQCRCFLVYYHTKC